MNCEQCQGLLVEYSLGELDRSQCAGVERHLTRGCVACQSELVELQEAMGLIGASLDEVAPPPSVKQELLTRIAAGKRSEDVDKTNRLAATSTSQQSARDLRSQRIFAYAATLLCGLLIGSLVGRQFAGDHAAAVDRDAQLAEILESARENFGAPEVRFASLRVASDENAVVGHMMWDAKGRNLHIFAFDVEQPAADRQLAVWFVPAKGDPRYAGELKLAASGACAAVFAAPLLDEPVAQVVVTEEPVGDISAPSGPQRIISRFE